jgi:hypothetical protein
MKFRLIMAQHDTFPVRVMCDVMDVSPAGYYAWRGRPESPRKAVNRALLTEIRRVYIAHRGRYGAPRIHAALCAGGHRASRGRVERLMGHHRIRAQTPRRFRVCTTDSNHDLPLSTHRIYPMCPFYPQSARPQFCGRTAQSGLARQHRRIRQSSEASLRPRIYHARASRAKSRLSRCPLNRGKVKRLYLRFE